MSRNPMILVFAGPNGSGKSTITKQFENLSPLPGIYINADDIKAEERCSDMEAARKAEVLRNKALSERKDFAFETVLSTQRNLELLRKAREKGYFIKAFYVITKNPEINVHRVEDRVADGGHNVPKKKIIDRYYKSRTLIPELIEVCDVVHIYDNSGTSPQRIYKKKKSETTFFAIERWPEKDIAELVGITKA